MSAEGEGVDQFHCNILAELHDKMKDVVRD
jgi:hypothetical protein